MNESTQPGEQPGDEQKNGAATTSTSHSGPEQQTQSSDTNVPQEGAASPAAGPHADAHGWLAVAARADEAQRLRPTGDAPTAHHLERALVGLVPNSDAEIAAWLYQEAAGEFAAQAGHALFANIGGALFMCHRITAGYVWRPATAANVRTFASKASSRYERELDEVRARMQSASDEARGELAERIRALGRLMVHCEKAATIRNLGSLLYDRLITELPSMPERKANADRLALACGNGLVNLRDGSLRWIRPDDYVTVYTETAFDREQDTTHVAALVREIAESDEYARFLHVWHGYGATGSTQEHCLVVEIGGGRNGKSTINAGVAAALGDYACPVPDGMLEQRGKHGDATDNSKTFAMARLMGKRYMFASETGDRQRFSDAQVKRLTGEQTVSGRFPGGSYIEIQVEAKFTVLSQHVPGFDGRDQAMRKRLRVVEFLRTYGSQEDIDAGKAQYLARVGLDELVATDDPQLGRRAWLAWLVEGARTWIADGLAKHTPAGVRLLTDKHAQNNDLVAMFVRDVLVPLNPLQVERARICEAKRQGSTDDKLRVECRGLYGAFQLWCKENGHPFPLTSRKFADQLVASELFGEDIAETGEVRRVSLGRIERFKGPGGLAYFYRYLLLNNYGRDLWFRANGGSSAGGASMASGDTEGRM